MDPDSGRQKKRWPVVTVDSGSVRTIARGHPWVYSRGTRGRGRLGHIVRVEDPRGRSLGYGLADTGPIAVRMLGREPPSDLAGLVASRIGEAVAWRRRVVSPQTDAFRVVNGAGDGLPGVVVDRYGSLVVVRLYSRAWEPHLDLLSQVLLEQLEPRWLLRRLGVRRVDGKEGSVFLHGGSPPATLVVQEHGVRFLVRPLEGQKTGLFLDQRENRHWLAGHCRDQEVIDLFGYTGGFSVHAASGGARRVVVVDQSGQALADARENLALNHIDPDRHGFEQGDVFTWRPPSPAGVVVCDPPSMARHSGADGKARSAYRKLNRCAAGMVAAGGMLATASCTARLSPERWEQEVREGVASPGTRWRVVHRAAEPPDHPIGLGHPEGRYLKFAVLWKHAT